MTTGKWRSMRKFQGTLSGSLISVSHRPRQLNIGSARKHTAIPLLLPQTPRVSVRAGGTTTQWLPYTGTDLPAARQLAANLVEPPELPNLQALLELVGRGLGRKGGLGWGMEESKNTNEELQAIRK